MRGNSFKTLFCMVSVCLCACARDVAPPSQHNSIPDQIAVAAIEFLIPAAQRSSDLIYCLRVDGQDANSKVLRLLRAKKWQVVPASHCAFTDDDEISVYQPSGARASFIALEQFSMYGQTSADLVGATFTGKLSGSTFRLDLHLNADRWQVVGQQPIGVA